MKSILLINVKMNQLGQNFKFFLFSILAIFFGWDVEKELKRRYTRMG